MILADKKSCTGCGACAAVCPARCIEMKPDEDGFLFPQIDADQCLTCETCRKVCPIINHADPVCPIQEAYAAKLYDNEKRESSTSGGVFSAICEWIFENDGIVFGAAFDSDFQVYHACAYTSEQAKRFRGAKYTQSRPGNSISEAKQLLESGKYVLYSGTPCQIAGLKAALGREYPKLITVDLICHGVPAPMVWQRYLQCKSDQQCGKPIAVNMRSKEIGWSGYSVHIEFDNGSVYSEPNNRDTFIRAFVGDLCLRQSCYQCNFKGISRNSDFTLGDYWGVWNQMPDFDDNRGVSLVLLHTGKAKEIWTEIAEKLDIRRAILPDCLQQNGSALQSSPLPKMRRHFMAHYKDTDFDILTEKALKINKSNTYLSRLRRKLSKIKHILMKH